ncbi:hypothetical protein SEHO0A_00014 [Salmonella enterica subsp. houtenae str. ATCC BAA-1581]|nr:hypothetical protein SEHO0A_00014 [Salmonella enterica subsp. houtenae str. ATCC BAA-1581]
MFNRAFFYFYAPNLCSTHHIFSFVDILFLLINKLMLISRFGYAYF